MISRHRATLSLLAALTLLPTACGEPAGTEAPSDAASTSEEAELVPFGLDVSNQSFAVPDVRLVVRVDGEVVVDEIFDVGTQHNWKRFDLALAPGEHELTAEAPEHGQTFSTRFSLREERWATLNYWGEGNGGSEEIFSWYEHDRAPAYA